jgi:hypothetical protein
MILFVVNYLRQLPLVLNALLIAVRTVLVDLLGGVEFFAIDGYGAGRRAGALTGTAAWEGIRLWHTFSLLGAELIFCNYWILRMEDFGGVECGFEWSVN